MTTSIPDSLLEQLIVCYLKQHSDIPGATQVLEHLSESNADSKPNSAITDELYGFDRQLAQRLTHLSDEKGNKLYRFRLQCLSEPAGYITIYFEIRNTNLIPRRTVIYYLFNAWGMTYSGESELIHKFHKFLDELVHVMLLSSRPNFYEATSEANFIKGFRVVKAAEVISELTYRMSDFSI